MKLPTTADHRILSECPSALWETGLSYVWNQSMVFKLHMCRIGVFTKSEMLFEVVNWKVKYLLSKQLEIVFIIECAWIMKMLSIGNPFKFLTANDSLRGA